MIEPGHETLHGGRGQTASEEVLAGCLENPGDGPESILQHETVCVGGEG